MNNPITIAILIDDISRMAGTERAASNLANLLVNRCNCNVHIISFEMQNSKPAFTLNEKISVLNLEIHNYTKSNVFFRIYSYPKILRKTSAIIKLNRVDTLIGTGHAINFLLAFFSMQGKINTIGCEHFDYFGSPFFSRIIRNFLYRFLNKIVVLTARDQTIYKSKGIETVAIPNSISFTCNQSPNYNKKRIIAAGRLTEQKGFDLLIDIAYRVIKDYPDWQFSIFGDGELKEELQNKIDKLKISENFKIYPPTKNIEFELLNSSIFALSSRWEGLPMMLLESMEVGLPVVSFDCPTGPREIITHGIDGLIVEEKDINAFYEALITLIQSTELRFQYGQAAKKNIKQFSEEHIAKRWGTIINQFI